MSAVQTFLDAYRSTFASFDRSELLAFFAFPLHVASATADGVVLFTASEDDWPAVLDSLIASYQTLEVAGAEPLSVDTVEVTPSLLSLRVRWDLRRADGSTVYEFTAVYTVVERDGGFRVTAVAHDELPQLGAALEAAFAA